MKLSRLRLHLYQWLAKTPLGVLLTVPFLFQLLGAMGVVAYLSHRSGERSVNDFADQLMDQVAVRVKDRLDSYLQLPHSTVKLSRIAVEDEKLNLEDFEQLEEYFFNRIQHFQTLTTLTFGNSRGEVIGVGRDRMGIVVSPNAFAVWENLGAEPRARRFYEVDNQRQRLKLTHTDLNFDVRERYWYKAAVKAKKQSWSTIIAAMGLPIAGVSAVAPIYQDGVLKGVFSSDLLLSDISAFLGSLNFSPKGQAFIIERSGDLVATSTQEKIFTKSASGSKLNRLNAINSQYELTRATTQAILNQEHNWSQIHSRQQFTFDLNGQRQFGYAIPYRDHYGLDWLLITTIPKSDFTAEINANYQQTLLLWGLTLLIAIGTGILTVYWIAKPIQHLQQAANAIAQGQLDYPIETGGVGEVAQLSKSFWLMTQQLEQAEHLRTSYEQELQQQVAERTEALHQSEAQMRAILSAIPDIMMLVSNEGIYLDQVRVNLASEVISEIINPIGKAVSELLPPALATLQLQAIQQAIATDIPQIYEQQVWLQGKSQYEEIRVVACGDNAALVMIRNVSDRYEVDRIKDEFISIVSHELRTPLTAISGSLILLESGLYDEEPDEFKEMLKIASNNSVRLVRLVNDILDLERLESSRVQLVMEYCEIETLIQQAIESVQAIADEANVTLSTTFSPTHIWAAPDAIVQIFVNLLSNAIKFSDPGSTVWLSAELGTRKQELETRENAEKLSPQSVRLTHRKPNDKALEPSPYILFSVQDQGRGIPLEKLETIFERFQQVDASDSRQKRGTGLGLAICKTIVHQHGGQIWVESALEKGSTFYFTLPGSPLTSLS